MDHTVGLVILLVEWNDFLSHRSSTVGFQIECDSVGIWI